MARIFIDGFEAGQPDLWDAENNATVVSSAGLDMDGDYCLDLNASSEYLEKVNTADDEMYFAFLYRPASDNAKGLLTILNSGTMLIAICKNSPARTLSVRSGLTLATVLDTGIAVLDDNTTYLIEAHIKIADAGGIVDVKVNGILDITFAGDTKPDANTQFNQVCLGRCNDSIHLYGYSYFDNFIMEDADWIGDTKIQAIVPTGVGNTTGWTPSAGANWQCVDEKPASDVDYVSIDAVDTTDTYGTENMAGTIDNIKCVQIQARSRTEGAPTPTNLKLAVRSGATDYLSGDKTVPVAEKGLWHLWENNPADAAAWEEADVNAMEIGFKSAA